MCIGISEETEETPQQDTCDLSNHTSGHIPKACSIMSGMEHSHEKFVMSSCTGCGPTLFQAGWALDSSSWHIWCQSRSSALAFSVGLKRIRPACKAQHQAKALLAAAAGGC